MQCSCVIHSAAKSIEMKVRAAAAQLQTVNWWYHSHRIVVYASPQPVSPSLAHGKFRGLAAALLILLVVRPAGKHDLGILVPFPSLPFP